MLPGNLKTQAGKIGSMSMKEECEWSYETPKSVVFIAFYVNVHQRSSNVEETPSNQVDRIIQSVPNITRCYLLSFLTNLMLKEKDS
jgi:hypothetical protein